MGNQAPVRAASLRYYRKHITDAIGEEAIICLECGGRFKALSRHLRQAHNLPVEEYRARWGYNRITGLWCKVLADKYRALMIKNAFWGLSVPVEGGKQASTVPQGGDTAGSGRETILHREVSSQERPASRQFVMKVSDEALIRLARQRLTTRQIAKRTGLCPSAVGERLRKFQARGVELPRSQRWVDLPHRKVSDEELCQLAFQGFMQKEIAERKGVTPRAVRERLKKLKARGVIPPEIQGFRRRSRKVSDEELVRLSLQGLTTMEIATRAGVSSTVVLERVKRLRARGITLPPPRPRANPANRKVTNEELLLLAVQGLTLKQIADRKDMTPETISQRLRRLRAQGLLSPGVQGTRCQEQQMGDEELIRLSLQGLNGTEIAERTGANLSRVARRLKELRARGIGLPRSRHRWDPSKQKVSNEELLLLTAQGLTQSKIAALKGITRAAVNFRVQKLRARGLLPPRRQTGKGRDSIC